LRGKDEHRGSFGRRHSRPRDGAPDRPPHVGPGGAPSDPRVCRICGERALDMKYHLSHAHPFRGRPSGPRLDTRTEEALREVSSILDEVRENVFKEPLRATHLIDRARDTLKWLRDPSQARPPSRPPAPPAEGDTGGKRHLMRPKPKGPRTDSE
jgi:hypothetical protein